MLRNLILVLTAFAAGALIHLSMAPYNIWPASLVGTGLFAILICRNLNKKQTFNIALSFGMGLFGMGVNWLYVSIHVYGEVPVFLAFLFTLGFVLVLAFFFALPWIALPKIARSNSARFLCFPAIWLFSEWLRGWLFTGFPWLYLGYGQVEAPLSGWLPVIGVLGAGTLLACSAALVGYLLFTRTIYALSVCFVGNLIIWGAGIGLQTVDWTTNSEVSIPITLVQPNIPLRDKWNPAKASEIVEILEAESQNAWRPGLLIWPEAAIPYVGESAIGYVDFISAYAEQSNTAMVTGLLTYDAQKRKYLNSIMGVGAADSVYNKQRLVPFGEYVPLEDWLRGTMHFFNLPMSIISRGSSDQLPLSFEYHGRQFDIAPIICYEIAYTDLVRKLGRESEILVTLSNDSWFGTSIGPQQHMQIAQARALENQKPLARSTNNGVTALVDYQGRIYESAEQFTRTNLSATIEPRYGSTPYANIGNLPLLIMFSIIVCVCFLFGIRSK